ncbi:MAG TPA: hypothetical protein VG078_02930 [Acidimicrobiales bacterium]|nr:hypothetical protein [Acidimicrobiales bacterium]
MIRRSLRIGIRLGLLTGIAFVLFKIFQSRRTSPALPDVDGWAPSAERAPSPGPVLVQPTMPERSGGRTGAAPDAGVDEPSASVVPGPREPFAMVEPDAAAADASAPDDVPLDAVAGPTAEVDDPVAVAPQAEPSPAPTATTAPRKAPAATAAKKAAAKRAAAKKAGGKKAAQTKAAAKKAAASARAAARGATASSATVEQGTTAGWVAPTGGTCPPTHPVKAKMTTRIFHLPGMAAYRRVSADRCYADAEAAESDGLRAAKR